VGNQRITALTLRYTDDSEWFEGSGWIVENGDTGETIHWIEDKKGKKQNGEKHTHDWDNYGKCVICGKWDTESERS
jgi:hypothetical protein